MRRADLDADGAFDVVDPDDGSVIAVLPSQRSDAVAAAVARAEHDMRDTALPLHERIRILDAVAQTVSDEATTFAHALASEGVKTYAEARAEVGRCIQTLRLSAMAAHALTGALLPLGSTARLTAHHGYYRYGPIGVTAALTPYNDPLNLVAHKLGPAMAAGNSVVLYADQRTPLSALLLCRAFWRAGTPVSTLQVLLGDGGEIVPTLLGDSRVRAVTATGGGRLARAVEQSIGTRKLILELGGVCPAVVGRDADLDLAAEKLAAGAFSAAGQNCLHPQVIAVEDAVYEAFVRRLQHRFDARSAGHKFDAASACGPLIDSTAAQRVDAFVADALHKGARPVTGGSPTVTPLHRQPLLLRDVRQDARLWTEEVFGPVTAVRSVTDVAAGLRAVAHSGGLQASVFTSNVHTAESAVATLRQPSVVINDADVRFDGMPFGGDGTAGLNREGPAFAVRELSSIQTVLQQQQHSVPRESATRS
ncbi:hypothetical protein AFA91_05825 [Mycolicibacterium goodii]|uniref:Aldehyde dehydrogenase domain-containing protein n=1 Tax=Mycolicibacterium goodii TaxID=134601 RepID=A0A0K0XFI3_MYCGD|nr:hypothetical protein AFA91_05825 [Mycolicibacterium goodii]